MLRRPSLAAIFVLACSLARGEVADPPADVGRVSYAQAEVSLQSEGARVLEQATRNWPLTAGDRILTGPGSRAELGFALATARLDEGTELTVLHVARSALQLSLDAGRAAIQVRELQAGDAVTVRLRDGEVQLRQAGEYRIEIPMNGGLALIVRQGEARVDTGGPTTFQQFAGEHASIAADGTVSIERAPRADAFDRWIQERKRSQVYTSAQRHVARGLVGYEDLDAHGEWRWERDYGMVWTPDEVSEDWAPYRDGQWILKSPWGWTWVDNAAWGFAPFHYGRWVYVRERWNWLPGPRQLPAVYAPALVRWIDHPTRANEIGWAALGPYDLVDPLYSASERHVQALNTFSRPGGRPIAIDPEPPESLAVTWMDRSAFARRAADFRQRTARVDGN